MLLIRRLGPDDHSAYRDIRLRALREEPIAFSANEEDESTLPLPVFADRLCIDEDRFMLGAFHGDALVGIVGVTRESGAKQRHKAFVRSMYMATEQRGLGAGRNCLSKRWRWPTPCLAFGRSHLPSPPATSERCHL